MKKKKNNSNPPHEEKLATTKNNSLKIQKKSIAKTNLLNQITSNGEEKIKLCKCKQKKKKNKSIEKAKGKCILEPFNNYYYYNNNTEKHVDVDQVTCHFNCPFKDDIIMEILCRLPVRYLVQFKCVSKLWNALISDPYFVNKHLNHAKNDPHSQKLLFYQRCPAGDTPPIYSCPLSIYSCPLSSVQLVDKLQKLPSSSTTRIYCTYNGLAIIRVFDFSCKRFIRMLWNPSTRESILLPQPEFPLERNYSLGLGYDSTSGDYKILKIHDGIEGSKITGEILSLKSGSWRNIDKHPRGIDNWLSGTALAYVNDACHWICKSGNFYDDSIIFSLVSFSISNEVYTDIPLPEQILRLKGYNIIDVSELDGMLCVHSTRRKCTFKLWVLKDYGVNESWIALFSIDDSHICTAVPKYRFADGEVLFWSIHLLGKITRYSFRTSRGPFGICDAIQGGFAFTESLISPKSLI